MIGDYESLCKYWWKADDEYITLSLFYWFILVVEEGFYFEVMSLSRALFIMLYLKEEFKAPPPPIGKDGSQNYYGGPLSTSASSLSKPMKD